MVTYTCNIINGTAVGLTDWTLPTGTCTTNFVRDKIRLSQSVILACQAVVTSTCGPYTASSLPPSDSTNCLSSILTVNITAAMNGSTVTCSNTQQSIPSTTTIVSLATINVVGMLFICVVCYTCTWLAPLASNLVCCTHEYFISLFHWLYFVAWLLHQLLGCGIIPIMQYIYF